ncbi:MAG: hypothetical protein Q9227_004814 [Pyrenula ochraceoflavens]
MRLPFHAEHIGSFLRPSELLEARKLHEDGSKRLEAAEDDAITQLVNKQIADGVTPIMDGEYRRYIFYSGFDRIPGFKAVPDLSLTDFKRTPVTRKAMELGLAVRTAVVCTEKIRDDQSPFLAEWEGLKRLVPVDRRGDCKLTLPTPTWHHLQLPAHIAYSSEVYKDDESFFADLTKVYHTELQRLSNAGLRSVQFDDPNLLFFLSDQFRQDLRARGDDPEKLLDLYIKVHNNAIEGRPGDLHVGIHLCRGNWGSLSFVDGSYEPLAEKLFQHLNYDTFYLEFDTPRAGDFGPLRFLPVDKNVVLGLISTKTSTMEDIDILVERVHEAADVISKAQRRSKAAVLGHIAISPQCGFSSSSEARAQGINEDVMWKKLNLVKEVAERIWPL